MTKSWRSVWISAVALTIIAGCAMFSPTLVDQGIVRIELEKSETVQLLQSSVYKEDGLTIVRGEVAFPSWQQFGEFTGHMDIEIGVPGGKKFKAFGVSVIPMTRPETSGRRAFFLSKFAIDPPRGTIVRIRYHEGKHREAK